MRFDELLDLVDRALEEDVGTGDVTTEATVPADAARGRDDRPQAARRPLRTRGRRGRLPPPGPDCADRAAGPEGVWHEVGAVALRVEGPRRRAADRRAHRAQLRAAAVRRRHRDGRRSLRATRTPAAPPRSLDTRKTTPGLRAPREGRGGRRRRRQPPLRTSVRRDPHQGQPHRGLAGGVGAAVTRRAGARPRTSRDRGRGHATSTELDEALAAGAEVVLLDNMTPEQVARGGRADRRPGADRGLGRHHPGDSCGLCDHKGARLRLARAG